VPEKYSELLIIVLGSFGIYKVKVVKRRMGRQWWHFNAEETKGQAPPETPDHQGLSLVLIWYQICLA
jgi:hypothetical protein